MDILIGDFGNPLEALALFIRRDAAALAGLVVERKSRIV